MHPVDSKRTLCEYKNRYKQVHTVITSRLKDEWVDLRIKEHIEICDNKNVQVTYNSRNGLFLLCFPDLLMVDFDTDEKMDKDQALWKLREYVHLHKQNDLLFHVYETDRGIHAFLVNRLIDKDDQEAAKSMLQLCSDAMYVGYIPFRGFCVRLSPKFIGSKLKDEVSMKKEFVARRGYGKTETVGTGQILEVVQRRLAFKEDCVAYFLAFVQTHINDFVVTKSSVTLPTNLIEAVKADIQSLLKKHDLVSEERYPITTLDTDSRYSGYRDILGDDLYGKYRKVTGAFIRFKANLIKDNFKKDNVTYLVNSDQYNFKAGFDLDRKMIFIVYGNLLVVDWDYPAVPPIAGDIGLQMDTILQIVRQYCANVSRLYGLKLTFRMYKTDNGVHAFCTSHTFPHGTGTTMDTMIALCCDPDYIAFTHLRGFSLRMSPKVTTKAKLLVHTRYTPVESAEQFIQEPLLNDKGSTLVIGDGTENSALVSLVEFTYNVQKKVLKVENLHAKLTSIPSDKERMSTEHHAFLDHIREIVLRDYTEMEQKLEKPVAYCVNTKICKKLDKESNKCSGDACDEPKPLKLPSSIVDDQMVKKCIGTTTGKTVVDVTEFKRLFPDSVPDCVKGQYYPMDSNFTKWKQRRNKEELPMF